MFCRTKVFVLNVPLISFLKFLVSERWHCVLQSTWYRFISLEAWIAQCSVLRPVWVASFIGQVENITCYVILCGEVRHYPRFIGSSHLQTAYWAVSALTTPVWAENNVKKGFSDLEHTCSLLFLPFINALLTEAVCTRQDKVSLSIHTDAALLFISQLLHSV